MRSVNAQSERAIVRLKIARLNKQQCQKFSRFNFYARGYYYQSARQNSVKYKICRYSPKCTIWMEPT